MDIELNTEKMTARIEDGIGWMTFNNPERHNALALEMWQGMGDILEAFNSNENVRVVIMRVLEENLLCLEQISANLITSVLMRINEKNMGR